MTESEWLTTRTKPKAMLRHVRKSASARQLQLIGCGCCRLRPEVLADPLAATVVAAVEAFADRGTESARLFTVRDQLVAENHRRWNDPAANYLQRLVGDAAAGLVTRADVADGVLGTLSRLVERDGYVSAARWQQTRAAVCDLIREVAGNPFRRWQVVPDFLGGGRVQPDGTTVRVSGIARELAADIAIGLGFDRLPVLADALEESGVTDRELLDHCRRPGGHARGCWAVDVALGR